MAAALRIVLALAVVLVLCFFFRRVPEWELLIRGGKVEVRRGKMPGRFVAECEVLCTEWGIQTGKIRGFRNAGRISLRFSRDIPPEHHQRFRNAWGLCS